MTPYELLLSESQERMLLVAAAGEEDGCAEIFHRWGLEAVVVGRVTDDGRMRIRFHGEDVVDIPVDPVAQELPGARPAGARAGRPARAPEARSRERSRPRADLPGALARAARLAEPRLEGLDLPPVRSARAGQHRARSGRRRRAGAREARGRHADRARRSRWPVDCNPRWCWLDPYAGTLAAVAEAARNVACTGARPLALTNCLNFGNPEKPEIMWEFAEATRGLGGRRARARHAGRLGKRLLLQRDLGPRDPPDADDRGGGAARAWERHAVSHFPAPGRAIVLLGEHARGARRQRVARAAPRARGRASAGAWISRTSGVWRRCWQAAVAEGLVESAHDVSRGGLAVALARVLHRRAGAQIGAEVDALRSRSGRTRCSSASPPGG